MHLDEIRDGICESLGSVKGDSLWDNILQETCPANYGFEVASVIADRNDIWVDVPNLTFTFKNLRLSFSARLGGSNLKSGYDQTFHFKLSGSGSFIFKNGSQSIQVEKIDMDEGFDLDLYGESESRVD